MKRETYGLIPENPIRLDSEKSAMAYLDSLVTKKEAHHFLFHRLMSFDFNIFDGIEKTIENSLDIYELCTNNETFFTLFINIHCNECLWIPPAPFDFEFDVIYIVDKEMTDENEAEYTLVPVDKVFVNKIRANWEVEDFDKFYFENTDDILFRNWGVNYKVTHFPYDLWVSYLKENTVSVSDMTKEELEMREMALAEYDTNKITSKNL
jgi:hypothetical protein